MNDRPKLYIVPLLFEQITEGLATEEGPDPALVNALLEMGPELIDSYSLYIDEIRGKAKAKREMAREFTEAARRDEQTADNMDEYFKQILNNNFGGKAKTHLGTYFVKKTISFDYDFTPESHPEFFKVEYTIKKKELNDLQKAGALPSDIHCFKKETEAVVVRR